MIKILNKEVTLNNILEIIEEKLNTLSVDERLNIQDFETYFNSIKEKEIMDYSILQTLADWLTELPKNDIKSQK